MHKRTMIQSAVAAALLAASGLALAQDNVFRIGLILPMTGQQATTGRQIEAAARLWMAQNGDTVAGKKIQLIVKDDTSVPDVTRRLAQELVVNEKVNVLAGFGITPSATATAPIHFSVTHRDADASSDRGSIAVDTAADESHRRNQMDRSHRELPAQK